MYSVQSSFGKIVPALAASVAPGSLTSTAVIAEYAVIAERVDVQRLAVVVSTAVVSTGSVVVTVRNRPTVGSATGQSTITTLTIPAGTAAGKVVYKDINQANLIPGGSIAFEVTTASAGGGAAGAVVCGMVIAEDPEDKRNESAFIASA